MNAISAMLTTEYMYARICLQMLKRDLAVIAKRSKQLLLDSIMPLVSQVLIYGIFFPMLGMSRELIAPMFLGAVAFFIVFMGYSYALRVIFTIEFNKFFYYFVTLPLPKRWLMLRYILSGVIELCILATPLLIIGIWCLSSSFAAISPRYGLFILFYIVLQFFYSTLFLSLGVYYRYKWFSHNIFPRRLTPLFCISPIFAVWGMIYQKFPVMAKLMLLNPFTYVSEGIRSAYIGGNAYISVYICIVALLCFIAMQLLLMSYGLKKRIDPV